MERDLYTSWYNHIKSKRCGGERWRRGSEKQRKTDNERQFYFLPVLGNSEGMVKVHNEFINKNRIYGKCKRLAT